MSSLFFPLEAPFPSQREAYDEGKDGTTRTSTTLTDAAPVTVHRSKSIRGSLYASHISTRDFTIDKLQFASLGELFGRKKELDLLHDLIMPVVANHNNNISKKNQEQTPDTQKENNKRQLIAIGGAAGAGKSVLALETKKWIRKQGGIFIAGKFDQQLEDKPYSAIANAFRTLCEDLLFDKHRLKTEKSYNQWKFSYDDFVSKLQTEFDSVSLELLCSIIPGLDQVIGKLDDDSDINENSAQQAITTVSREVNYKDLQQAFTNEFCRFVRMISSFGAVLLVLDDMQWVDENSMELIEAILSDANQEKSSSSRLTIIVTYRDNEVHRDHMFLKAMNRLQNAQQISVSEIPVGNLTTVDIQDLLRSLLTVSDDDKNAQSLEKFAECVHRKTAGNALYVKQFLLSIEEQRLVSFNFGSMRWEWDVEKIALASQATDNVVHLLTEKLKGLPGVLQGLLPRVACLGSAFMSTTFQILANHYCDKQLVVAALELYENSQNPSPSSPQQTVDGKTASHPDEGNQSIDYAESKTTEPPTLLTVCQVEGLISVDQRGHCRWEHDKVQEAAIGLVDRKELAKIKYGVGDLLVRVLPPDELASQLFMVTNLLNTGGGAVDPDQSKAREIELAKLNLAAGQAALASSAFSSASAYLAKGIALLPDSRWESYQSLALELYANAAEASYCMGTHKQTEELCNEVLCLPSIKLLDKQRFYNVLIYTLNAQELTIEARQLTLQVLAKLNCKFPKWGRMLQGLVGVLQMSAHVDQTVARLEKMTAEADAKNQWVISLLDKLATIAYQTDVSYLLLALIKGLRITIDCGVAKDSAPMLASVGLLLAGSIGDFAGGKKYADLALKTMNRETKSRTLFIANVFVLHHQMPYDNVKKPLLEGYEAGLKTGDLESAFWCIYNFLDFQVVSAVNLEIVLADIETYYAQVDAFHQDFALWGLRVLKQVVLDLARPEPHRQMLHRLSNANADLESGTADVAKERAENYWKHFVAFWLNEHDLVIRIMEQWDFPTSYEKGQPGLVAVYSLYFYSALSSISLAREQPNVAKHRRRARKFLSKFKRWVEKGNPNVQHCEALLEAELASLHGKNHGARKHFDIAILLAGRLGQTNHQALAHERLADHAMRIGDKNDAGYNYKRALDLYDEWGAVAKTRVLRASIGNLLAPASEVNLDVALTVADVGPMSAFSTASPDDVSSALT